MRKLVKEPLVQFLLIGAAIYAAYALIGAPDERAAARTVVISKDRIDNLAALWERRWNRAPTELELAGLVRSFLREDLLYREAVAMGLDQDDHIVRRRLAQKLEFLTSDIIELREPDDNELEAFFADNRARFQSPDLITFAHVFFNPDTRGDTLLDDATSVLAKLDARGETNPDELDEGDRLMLPGYFVDAPEPAIRRQMGSEFSAAVMRLEPGKWHGPVSSGFGIHLVYVYAMKRAPLPELAAVRENVIREWQRMETEKFNAEFLNTIKSRYDIRIEAPAEFSDRILSSPDDEAEVAIPDGEAP